MFHITKYNDNFFAQPVHLLICIFVKIYENILFHINVNFILFSGN